MFSGTSGITLLGRISTLTRGILKEFGEGGEMNHVSYR
jgi:hypothetical protein